MKLFNPTDMLRKFIFLSTGLAILLALVAFAGCARHRENSLEEMLLACTRHTPNQRLLVIDQTIEENPQGALKELKEMNPDTLDSDSRHFRDLLLIKASDKAYITHTSDSLILDIVDYYETHPDAHCYPEALYYGGRVYSDLGDLPTALDFYQKSLDATPDDKDNLRFKVNVLSQTGRLLDKLRMYRQAIHYLKHAINLSRELKDSVRIFYDAMLLTSIYKDCDSLSLTKGSQAEALRYSKALSVEDQAWLDVERASTFLYENKIDSAVSILRPALLNVDTLCRNYALSIAAHAYNLAGIKDTAYIYAKVLAFHPNPENRLPGFTTLLSPELYDLIPKDSLRDFEMAYTREMEAYLSKNQSRETMIQNSRYNYNIHVEKRRKAETEKVETERKFLAWIIASLIVIFVLISKISQAKVRNKINELRLRVAIQLAKELRYKLLLKLGNADNCPNPIITATHSDPKSEKAKQLLLTFTPQQEKLRKELLQELSSLGSLTSSSPKVDDGLPDSPIVKELRKMLDSKKAIKDDMWEKIETAVLRVAPEFKSTLNILTLDKMTDREYQVALLMRCGIKPKEISSLLSRGKSAITDRRRALSQKIFGDNAEKGALDNLIASL